MDQVSIVIEQTNGNVAMRTKQTTDNSGLVVMVNTQDPRYPVLTRRRFWTMTNSTRATLSVIQGVIVLNRDAIHRLDTLRTKIHEVLFVR